MKQIDHFIKVKKSDVSFVCTYLEAFEGMAAIRTPNPKLGEDTVLHIMVSSDYGDQYDAIIKDLAKDIVMEEVEP